MPGETAKFLFDAQQQDAQTLITAVGWTINPLRAMVLRDDRVIERVYVINASKLIWPAHIRAPLEALGKINRDITEITAARLLHDNIRQSLTLDAYRSNVGTIEVFPHGVESHDFEIIEVKVQANEYRDNLKHLEEYNVAMRSFENTIKEIMQQSVLPRVASIFLDVATINARTMNIARDMATKDDIATLKEDLANTIRTSIADLGIKR